MAAKNFLLGIAFLVFGTAANAAVVTSEGIRPGDPAGKAAFRVKAVIDAPNDTDPKELAKGRLVIRVFLRPEAFSNPGARLSVYLFDAVVNAPKFPFRIELTEPDFHTDFPQKFPEGNSLYSRVFATFCKNECARLDVDVYRAKKNGYALAKKDMDFGSVQLRYIPDLSKEELSCANKNVFASGSIATKDAALEKKKLYLAFFRSETALGEEPPQSLLPLVVTPLQFKDGVANFSIPKEKSFAPEYAPGWLTAQVYECPLKPNSPMECIYFQSRYTFHWAPRYLVSYESRTPLRCGDSSLRFTLSRN